MKRDMSLIRDLLTYLEKQPSGIPITRIEVSSDIDGSTLSEHLQLLLDRNLIEGEIISPTEPAFLINRLTWDGHDFLQAIKNKTVWKKIMEKGKSLGGAMTLEIAKDLGKKYLMELAGIPETKQ